VFNRTGHTHKDLWIHHHVCEIFPMGKSKSQLDSRVDSERSCADLDLRVWRSATILVLEL
jgi:hypothetical protein